MKGIIKSFNPKCYDDLAGQGVARGFGFLIVFVIMVGAVMSLNNIMSAKKAVGTATIWLKEHFPEIIKDLPQIEIKGETLVSPQEYYEKVWTQDGESMALIIEPDQTLMYSAMEKFSNVVVLSKSKGVVKSSQEGDSPEVEIVEYKDFTDVKITPSPGALEVTIFQRNFTITSETAKQLFSQLWGVGFVLLWIVSCFGYFFNKLFGVLLFSLISLIFNAHTRKQRFSYERLFTIGIYAIVPPTCLSVLVTLLGGKIPGFFIIYCLVYIAYLFLAIRNNEEEEWKESAS